MHTHAHTCTHTIRKKEGWNEPSFYSFLTFFLVNLFVSSSFFFFFWGFANSNMAVHTPTHYDHLSFIYAVMITCLSSRWVDCRVGLSFRVAGASVEVFVLLFAHGRLRSTGLFGQGATRTHLLGKMQLVPISIAQHERAKNSPIVGHPRSIPGCIPSQNPHCVPFPLGCLDDWSIPLSTDETCELDWWYPSVKLPCRHCFAH